MRIVRFSTKGKIKYGKLVDGVIYSFQGGLFTNLKSSNSPFILDRNTYQMDDVRILAPCLPTKIVCLGLNYRDHAEETKLDIPAKPLIFLKPPTALIGPDDRIILPRTSRRVDYEGELGVVIGRKAKDVPEEKTREYVLGYTCFNDVSERYDQREDGQWTRAKGYDTFAPLGPCIETEVDPGDLRLETYLNGELCQSASTSELIFGVSQLISFVSNVMTLLPGDVIATGTPSGIGCMNPGDVVEVRIEKIGTLRNFVVGQK